MREAQIHFKNESFMARVVGKGDEPIKCTPVVYDEPFNCGLGIFYEDGKGEVWGMVSPRNLIAAWRGTEVLRRLDIIEIGTHCAAYYTGVRDPLESDMKSYVEPTIAKIGRAAYDEIMSMPVPEEIVTAILLNQKDEFAPALYPITDEVRAGTIQWRHDFAAFDIKHPDDVDAEKRAQKETIAKFERLLTSYARSRSLDRQCYGMWYVEGALLTLVNKGANQTHPDHVLIALAGVVCELAVSQFAMSFMPFGPSSKEEYDAQTDKRKGEAIGHSANWLASNTSRHGWSRLVFWKRNQNTFTRTEAQKLLTRLLAEYFPPKEDPAPA